VGSGERPKLQQRQEISSAGERGMMGDILDWGKESTHLQLPHTSSKIGIEKEGSFDLSLKDTF
jgi:hypothetical protein